MAPVAINLRDAAAFACAVIGAVGENGCSRLLPERIAGIVETEIETAQRFLDQGTEVGIEIEQNRGRRARHGGALIRCAPAGRVQRRDVEIGADRTLQTGNRGVERRAAGKAKECVMHGEMNHRQRARTCGWTTIFALSLPEWSRRLSSRATEFHSIT